MCSKFAAIRSDEQHVGEGLVLEQTGQQCVVPLSQHLALTSFFLIAKIK
jgi:hypothetical protein